LIFTLKDLMLQISSGISLYEAFRHLAQSQYPEISEQFRYIVTEVDTGKSMIQTLEEVALTTKSQYFKRTCWQIVNALKTGTNLKEILSRIVAELSEEQKNKIRNYARELNLWSLLYMLFAVAVPSIGSTMLVILSSFAGFGIDKTMFIIFLIITFVIQIVLIGFVKSRRPIAGI
ncbi:MAG: type II secretion system F family protein, partial [Candidatus Woesearchaeota archaeon]